MSFDVAGRPVYQSVELDMKTLKNLIAVAGAALATGSTALAHEGEMHAAGSGLFGLPPEYVHVLINPMPVYGMAMGVLALGLALLARNKTAQTIGLGLLIIAAASAWPVAHFGQNAYKHVRGMADDAGQDALDEHMERAEKVIYIFYATAFVGFIALVIRKKFPKAATPLVVVTLVMGVASLGAGGWISKAGGQIRHPEFREASGASTNAGPHEHGAAGESHEKMQPAEAGGHQHKMTMSDQTAEKTPLPDTIEGVWKAIHEQHDELAVSVNARQFKAVQSPAAMLRDLARHLTELTRPEQKPGVESVVGKIIQALDDLKSSAETGSDTVMKIRLKEFETALAELEPPTKKP